MVSKPKAPLPEGFEIPISKSHRVKKLTRKLEKQRKVVLKQLSEQLGAARVRLSWLNPSVSIKANSDGTIDAEVRFRDLPTGIPVEQVMIDIEQEMRERIADSWTSVGVTIPPPGDQTSEIPAEYDRLRGETLAMAYWQGSEKIAGNFATARDIVINFREKTNRRWRKPSQVVVRYHWDPEASGQPNR